MYLSVLRIALNTPLYLKLWTQKEVELKMGHSFFLSVFTMLISFCDCEKDQTHLSEKH